MNEWNGEIQPVRERDSGSGWLKQAQIATILFDIDGVLLSEESYFDASALTVWELLTSPSYLGLSVPGLPAYRPDPDARTIRAIRSAVFDDDRVLDFMKQRGINANWDMVYLQFAAQLAAAWEAAGVGMPTRWTVDGLRALGPALDGGAVQFAAIPEWFHGCADKADLFARTAERLQGPDAHALWDIGREAFQAWYLGDEHYEGPPSGKRGFLQQEVPLVPADAISRLLSTLRGAGFRLGIATGRPRLETYVPLRQLGWLEWFDAESITTASDVVDAERAFPERRPLSKPHPFAYVRSWLGRADSEAALQQSLPIAKDDGERVLVVGDSLADWMAAQAAGFRFAAVLTGLTGEAAREGFAKRGCDRILDTVLDLSTGL